ncbi:LuxR C-terminal-related transcriptional regulator [Virgisporangium ochraceum]|uniref:LuxR C-terminal-related transcriptional regulator n=1 Tax=Virgisporangium ochraceum TaxID=65505 RepID=UPI001942C19D|nr:LuxR C-terminal-related transcriptional regulator [Virgisporangium ochraceum]
MTVTSDDDGSQLRVTVGGRWDWRVALAVRTAVNKCLAEHPGAVIVDLGGADDPRGSSVALLAVAYRVGRAMRPRVSVAVCIAPGSPLERRMGSLGAAWFVPRFTSVPLARAALEQDRVVPSHLSMRLQPVPVAARQARRLVAEAGYGWDDVVRPAQLVVSELVTNVVRHVGTEMSVSVSRRHSGLFLAVRDGGPVLPRGAERYGLGLSLVDRIASVWGSHPTHQRTGKVVWAVVRQGHHLDAAASTARQILEYLPTTLSTEDIATRLRIPVNTMRAHLKAIYRKLGVSQRQEAASASRGRPVQGRSRPPETYAGLSRARGPARTAARWPARDCPAVDCSDLQGRGRSLWRSSPTSL